MFARSRDTIEDVPHEGELLRELLRESEKTPADLARACGVSAQAVQRYVQAERIGERAWFSVKEGLRKLGIDAQRIRSEGDRLPTIDLRPLVHDFSRSQLVRLKQILESSDISKQLLLFYISGKM
jgi:transcriptional regulator with XRE-family HTH domain